MAQEETQSFGMPLVCSTLKTFSKCPHSEFLHSSTNAQFSLLVYIYIILFFLFLYTHNICFQGHYENTPIQIYRKVHFQKPKIFR